MYSKQILQYQNYGYSEYMDFGFVKYSLIALVLDAVSKQLGIFDRKKLFILTIMRHYSD